jgi:hypothetical protein
MPHFVQKLKIALIYFFILTSFIPLFHYNVVQEYFVPREEYIKKQHPTAPLSVYKFIVGSIVKYSKRFVLGTVWKMYSSGRRTSHWFDWHLLHPNGAWILLETPNHSPRHRINRSFIDGALFDFKLGILQLSLDKQAELKQSYQDYLCRKAADQTGWAPLAVKPVKHVFVKRPPHLKGNSSFFTAPSDYSVPYPNHVCRKPQSQ